MKGYRYRITVEPLEDPKGQPIPEAPLTFETANHDELLGLVRRVRKRGEFDENTAAALLIGLKLFSEVMLQNREKPLFAPLMPHFREFMKRFKSPAAEPTSQ